MDFEELTNKLAVLLLGFFSIIITIGIPLAMKYKFESNYPLLLFIMTIPALVILTMLGVQLWDY